MCVRVCVVKLENKMIDIVSCSFLRVVKFYYTPLPAAGEERVVRSGDRLIQHEKENEQKSVTNIP